MNALIDVSVAHRAQHWLYRYSVSASLAVPFDRGAIGNPEVLIQSLGIAKEREQIRIAEKNKALDRVKMAMNSPEVGAEIKLNIEVARALRLDGTRRSLSGQNLSGRY